MNAIEKFAKEHGAEYEDEKTLAPLFKKAVQSVIGKKGKVRQAWTYTGSNEYGYVDWEASVVGVDGMMPEDEIVIVLTTDLDDGNSWVCGRYMDEYDTIAEVDDTPTDDPFDAVSVIDKLMSEVREERSSKGESKKNERGTTKIETYDGFDELLGYADAEYLLEDVVDVLSKYYTYEGEGDDIVFDEDQAKDDPEFTIKIEGGDERADFYSEDIFYVHLPNKKAAEELAKVLGGELSESKKAESKKSEDASSVDDLLARHNQKWLVKVSYDVDASHSAVAPSIVRADTKDAATNIALKRHRGLGYNMKVVSVEPMTESRKKSEGTGDFLDAKIDYNMFMHMCKTAAYLEEDEDYKMLHGGNAPRESRKQSEAYSDYDAIRDWLEGVMEKAGTMFESAHVSKNRPGEICAEIEGYDSTGGDAIISLVWNAGEDFAETISAMADELVEYAGDFDPEEEAEMYRNSGMAGVPSLRQLLKAMDERKEDMVSLAGAVSLAASKL